MIMALDENDPDAIIGKAAEGAARTSHYLKMNIECNIWLRMDAKCHSGHPRGLL
jgi:hypothetical protein